MKLISVCKIIVIATAISSCDPVPIDVQLPDGSKRITVNAYFMADSSWKVGVTRGVHVLNPHYDYEDLPNASVTILEDGQVLTNLTYEPPDLNWSETNGMYESIKAESIYPDAGKTYQVRVTADGFDDVSATCRIPSAVPIAEVNVISWELDENSMIALDVSLKDPVNEENFYELYVRTISEYYDNDGNLIQRYGFESPAYTQDPLFYQKTDAFDFLNPAPKPLPVMFNDTGLDGQTLKISCKASVYPIDASPNSKVYYKIVLRTLSKEYFQHVVTSNLQERTGADPFAQPVQIYTNVDRGFGIFAGYSQFAQAIE